MKQLALVRMATALLVWAEWAAPLRPAHHLDHPAVLPLIAIPWVSSSLLLFGVFSRTAAALTGASMLALVVWGEAEGLGGGGVAFGTLEAWLIALLACALAFTPCGAAWSVDAWRGTDGAERGGRIVFRVLASALFAGLALSAATGPFATGVRFEQLLSGRYGAAPLPGVAAGAAWLVIVGEAVVAGSVWVPRVRRPVLMGAAAVVLLAYPALYLGTFPAIVATLLYAALPADEAGL